MKFRIPFTIANVEKLKRKSSPFVFKSKVKRVKGKSQLLLDNADSGLTVEEYNAIKIRSMIIIFVSSFVLSMLFLYLFKAPSFLLIALAISFLLSGFVFVNQTAYPSAFDKRRIRNIEKNLIPALEDIIVQLNSGIPLFNILVNISASDYGELSREFTKVVRKINAGYPQMEVLEELGENNSSVYLKRTLWQISNGMRAGSDISIVIKESLKSLNEEQLLQIQNYGNKLNPLIMFYLLISVVLPALSITFLTILASMLSLEQSMASFLFIGVFVFVVLIQIMFLGTIKSIRPTLL